MNYTDIYIHIQYNYIGIIYLLNNVLFWLCIAIIFSVNLSEHS
jgi:hypothetical protein